MGNAKDKLIHLHERAPQRALDGLNRVTGLKFHHWPESLAPESVQEEVVAQEVPHNCRALPG
ncbi:hypothetical protein ACFW0H_21385 [Pseudomonas sp. CR3202]|uniref:hypothetical protein n=1 Tax=Pseudomonas sp. CR3202 TaxID=3351532 RepID=UPI003BF05916